MCIFRIKIKIKPKRKQIQVHQHAVCGHRIYYCFGFSFVVFKTLFLSFFFIVILLVSHEFLIYTATTHSNSAVFVFVVVVVVSALPGFAWSWKKLNVIYIIKKEVISVYVCMCKWLNECMYLLYHWHANFHSQKISLFNSFFFLFYWHSFVNYQQFFFVCKKGQWYLVQ